MKWPGGGSGGGDKKDEYDEDGVRRQDEYGADTLIGGPPVTMMQNSALAAAMLAGAHGRGSSAAAPPTALGGIPPGLHGASEGGSGTAPLAPRRASLACLSLRPTSFASQSITFCLAALSMASRGCS